MDERSTWFEVVYDLSDTSALEESVPVSNDNKNFADITLLKENVTPQDRMTLEHNFSLLDGSLTEFEDNPEDIAFFSNEMSDENGLFTNNPTIDVSFATYHSSYALTLEFEDVPPLEVLVTWKRDGSVLYSNTYTITNKVFVVGKDIQLYNSLSFEFTKAVPYHYVKLRFIRYGVVLNWNEKNVKSAKLVQELNVVPDKISVNTLSFEVVDTTDDMNLGNPLGMHNYYQRNQVMYPYEYVNGEKISLGKYYLDKFSEEKNLGKMSCVSRIGLLDTVQFNDGLIYNGIKAGVLLEQLFELAGFEDYDIDDETYNQKLYGTLKPQSIRNALASVLFACDSVIDTTDIETVKVRKLSTAIASDITRHWKISTKVTREAYISGIEIKYTTYELEIKYDDQGVHQPVSITKGTYGVGTHKIMFNEAYDNVTITGGTILKIMPYYAEIRVDTEGEVELLGDKYATTNNSIVREKSYLDPGEVENIKSFSTTLCSSKTATELADKLLNYYSDFRLKLNIKHIASESVMNNLRLVENAVGGYNSYLARFTKRTLDLTGGFIDTAELVAYFDTQNFTYFAGDEIIADNNVII